MKKLLLLSLMAIAIQTQAQNVGIGNPAPAEKLDVTGNINVTGTIKANGSGGTANQVLAKNASNNMAWVNTAHANDVRFSGIFNDNTTNTTGPAATLNVFQTTNSTLVYNTSGNTIVINKSGLYHFDVNVNISVSTTANPTTRPFLNLFAFLDSNRPLDVGVFHPTNLTDNSNWSLRGSKSFELYVTAPNNMTIPYVFTGITSKNLNVTVYGHLISE